MGLDGAPIFSWESCQWSTQNYCVESHMSALHFLRKIESLDSLTTNLYILQETREEKLLGLIVLILLIGVGPTQT